MLISKTSKSLQDQNYIIDLPLIKNFLEILFVLLIIFTILYFTFFGCFLVLYDSSRWTAQTVTLSSEGPANMTYFDSMGNYQLVEEDIRGHGTDGSMTVYNWYQNVDRDDRFLLYSNLGNIPYLSPF